MERRTKHSQFKFIRSDETVKSFAINSIYMGEPYRGRSNYDGIKRKKSGDVIIEHKRGRVEGWVNKTANFNTEITVSPFQPTINIALF